MSTIGPLVLRLTFAAAVMVSGLALLVHIVAQIPLAAVLAGTIILGIVATILVWTQLTIPRRRAVKAVASVGVGAGVAATAAYDLTRFLLSQLDTSPYNPFDTIHIFGVLLVGPNAPHVVADIAGGFFHLMNGVSFGVGYALLFGNKGVKAGVAWGLGLELFQLALYPGWLRLQFFPEFARISAASHVVYGATLGIFVRNGVRMLRRRSVRASRRQGCHSAQ